MARDLRHRRGAAGFAAVGSRQSSSVALRLLLALSAALCAEPAVLQTGTGLSVALGTPGGTAWQAPMQTGGSTAQNGCQVTVRVQGGGGGGGGGSSGGGGAIADISFYMDATWSLSAVSAAQSGCCGGGGAGGSASGLFVTSPTGAVIAVLGGGGGGGGSGGSGGNAGPPGGTAGGGSGGNCGGGGASTSGAGGGGSTSNTFVCGGTCSNRGNAGGFKNGGQGGSSGGLGSGASAWGVGAQGRANNDAGGGGGGGYYGGGGGCGKNSNVFGTVNPSGGGGGSSYVNPTAIAGTTVTSTWVGVGPSAGGSGAGAAGVVTLRACVMRCPRYPVASGTLVVSGTFPAETFTYTCLPGYYSTSNGGTTSTFVQACNGNTGVVTPATPLPVCVLCTSGGVNARFCTGGGPRTICPAGRFGTPGAVLTSSACSGTCAPGFYCPAGSTSSGAVPCGGIGVFCPAGSGAPVPVNGPGWYTTPATGPATTRTGQAP